MYGLPYALELTYNATKREYFLTRQFLRQPAGFPRARVHGARPSGGPRVRAVLPSTRARLHHPCASAHLPPIRAPPRVRWLPPCSLHPVVALRDTPGHGGRRGAALHGNGPHQHDPRAHQGVLLHHAGVGRRDGQRVGGGRRRPPARPRLGHRCVLPLLAWRAMAATDAHRPPCRRPRRNRNASAAGGPFQQFPTLLTFHPNAGNGVPFTTLGWAGFLGAISGASSSGMGAFVCCSRAPRGGSGWWRRRRAAVAAAAGGGLLSGAASGCLAAIIAAY